jgi:hypothetical protein
MYITCTILMCTYICVYRQLVVRFSSKIKKCCSWLIKYLRKSGKDKTASSRKIDDAVVFSTSFGGRFERKMNKTTSFLFTNDSINAFPILSFFFIGGKVFGIIMQKWVFRRRKKIVKIGMKKRSIAICSGPNPTELESRVTRGRCYDHNFLRFSAKNRRFLKNQCYDQNLHNLALFWAKNAIFFR